MSTVREKRTPIKPGDVMKCFSGKHVFFGKIAATHSVNQGWGSTKKYWVELPVDYDKDTLPSWRDKHEGTHAKFKQKQYEGMNFKAGVFYVELDQTVAKRVSPIELEVFKMKAEIFNVPKEKSTKAKSRLKGSLVKKKNETVEVDGLWHGVDANGWRS